jgi:hypothetical protein
MNEKQTWCNRMLQYNIIENKYKFNSLRHDVDITTKNVKNGKSPGPGNINLELIKYGGRKFLMLVTELLNNILQRDDIPQEMKTGYLILIHKK